VDEPSARPDAGRWAVQAELRLRRLDGNRAELRGGDGSQPFSVAGDLCLVHNGSFSNHASIRKELQRTGAVFGSANDSEVAPPRYLATRLEAGEDLETALERLGEVIDGFYTLVMTTKDGMAVVRDPVSCRPAVVAESDDRVAMASESRALACPPGIENARVFEPGRVCTWRARAPTTPGRTRT
jgi:glutamine phosphoribosylpyrophosphate amidotransferase